jgi:hypothetical protein
MIIHGLPLQKDRLLHPMMSIGPDATGAMLSVIGSAPLAEINHLRWLNSATWSPGFSVFESPDTRRQKKLTAFRPKWKVLRPPNAARHRRSNTLSSAQGSKAVKRSNSTQGTVNQSVKQSRIMPSPYSPVTISDIPCLTWSLPLARHILLKPFPTS